MVESATARQKSMIATPSNAAKVLCFLFVLCACASASSSTRNLPYGELPPLAIKQVIHKNDDPHELSEKKDTYGNLVKPRIVGGTDVVRGEYPFFVRIDHNFFPSCGGSLVAPDVVLTAGHCLPEDSTVTVRSFRFLMFIWLSLSMPLSSRYLSSHDTL